MKHPTKSTFLSLISLVLVASCTIRHLPTASETPVDNRIHKTRLTGKTDHIPYYQCDDYLAFQTEPNTTNIGSMFPVKFKCSKKPYINIHDQRVTDTIFTYTYKNNQILIYKSKYKDLLTLFDVTDKRLSMNEGVRPGMTKSTFSKKFSMKDLKADTVDVGNPDRTDVIRFYFKKNSLVHIKAEPYLD